MSLNKDKLLDIDLLSRNYDSHVPSTQNQAYKPIISNNAMEENYAFNNVHHIYDQV